MIRRSPGARSGITLTEILISIMILGIGVVSLATLFPIGLVRLHNAQKLSRGAFLVESAESDLGARNLLAKGSFTNPTISPWYTSPSPPAPTTFGQYDPWIQDTPAYGSAWVDPGTTPNVNTAGAYRGWGGLGQQITTLDASMQYRPGTGLPVAYDPLWRCVTGSYQDNIGLSTPECRFGSGIGFVRTDTDSFGTPGAHGLQRVTNLASFFFSGFPKNAAASPYKSLIAWPSSVALSDSVFVSNTYSVLSAFVSPEDVVFQERQGQYADFVTGTQMQNPSMIVPDLTSGGGSVVNDWRYTWFFTGQQVDAGSGMVYDGNIVVCENRPFAVDLATSPITGAAIARPAGERVVEAIWGYSSKRSNFFPPTSGTVDYGSLSAVRSVVLRWLNTEPDPEVKVGGWIADVTYERRQNVALSRYGGGLYPAQRCYWYQVSKKSEPTQDAFSGAYRSMTVWVSSPLQAQSLLDYSGAVATPVHVEAALIMPSVVNVYPRTIFSR